MLKKIKLIQLDPSTSQYHQVAPMIDSVDKNIDVVLYIEDAFTRQTIQNLHSRYKNITTVISNNLTVHDLDFVNFYGVPYWVCNEAVLFKNENFVPVDTNNIFTFNINKKQINRYLLLKLVDWFDLKNYSYTWSGIGAVADTDIILRELQSLNQDNNFTNEFVSYIQAPILIEPNFVNIPSASNIQYTDVSVINYGDNDATWKSFISHMTYDSAITLIAESVAYDKAMTFTEKTLYSVAGLTFPIWIGGYYQADEWENYGFDTFKDIINHDYQYYDTLIERTYYAFKFNYKILTDLTLAKQLRKDNMARLLANRQLLIDQKLSDAVRNYKNKIPAEIQNLLTQHGIFST